MRPLILVPTINSRHWNACYLQLLSVQRCQHPPQAERSCWGGGRPHDFRCAGGVPSSVRPLMVEWPPVRNRRVDPYFFTPERAQFCSDASYVFELKFSGRRSVRWSFFVTGVILSCKINE